MDSISISDIKQLARSKNAIILAHNYQPPEIQDAADLVGDSLELSIKAKGTDADIIVFCGVSFMAETAAIICPDKKVILPRKEAGCAMADMLTPSQLRKEKEKYKDVPVVTYVNSTAEVKAESTICCTSANSIAVVNSLAEDQALMVPDRNLAAWTALNTDKKIHYWNGYCPVHDALTEEDVKQVLAENPGAELMVHPECRPSVVALAHEVKSTSGMLAYPEKSSARKFIVATEVGMIYPLQKRYPDREFIPASPKMVCKDMKLISLRDLFMAIKEEAPVIKIEEDIRQSAIETISRMIDLSR